MSRVTHRYRHAAMTSWTPAQAGSSAAPGPATWRWLCASEAGVVIDGPAVRFATASAAQQWLDDNADVLFAQRIAWVNLLDGEHVIDGPRLLR